MIKTLFFSAKALEDLLSILEYVAKQRPAAAVRLVEAVEQRCELLASAPNLGMLRDDLAPQLRLFAFRGYGIYYRNLADGVRIERVLHGSLDVGAIMFDD